MGFNYHKTIKNCEIKNGKLISLEIYEKLWFNDKNDPAIL